MDRQRVAVSAATGSLTSSLLWVLKDILHQRATDIPFDLVANSCDCPTVELPEIPFNFWTGIGVGILLWPCLEFLILLKQWLILVLRAKITAASGEGRLYKVLA